MGKRISFQYMGFWQLELLPRARLQWLQSGLGLGIGWMCWWFHVWLYMRKN